MNDAIDPVPELPEWLLPRFPFARRVCTVEDQRFHLVDEGTGPVIVLMHGNPMWSFLWRKVIPPLRDAGYRVVAPDLIGLGLSSKPRSPGAHRLDWHVRLFSALMDQLGIESCVIAGQDWGARWWPAWPRAIPNA
ncbi:MAG: alpha/beta fold hydrolase [Candidatus Hydrogenedentes bacterium]|nr:alpha/beta fold hydrolase [Candidatus Hydrogenedentota bacterium]